MNDTDWTFMLYRDGVPYASRSMSCGTRTAHNAIRQWERNGFTVKVLRRPGTVAPS